MNTSTQPKPVIRIRAVRWANSTPGFEAPDHVVDHDEHTRTYYDTDSPAAALARFAEDLPHVAAARSDWYLEAYIPSLLPRPDKHLLNWEKNPDAEVSDGWLSNIAASGNTLADELEWQPKFCTRAHTFTPCPDCSTGPDGESKLAERYGKYGAFYTCGRCGWQTGRNTAKGKAAAAATRITGWCGHLLEVRYNNNGIPYPGCPACYPAYRSPTVSEIRYGRSLPHRSS